MKHSGAYELLLRELCSNNKVRALLELGKVEQKFVREMYYRQHMKYPQERDVADMIYYDLCEMLDIMASEKLQRGNE